jgi:type I restriction enzyme M protein
VTRIIARENPELEGVIDTIDFNQSISGQRTISDDSLRALIQQLNKKRLGINDVDPDILGRAYEYLLRKFAEGSGQSAGEFYTPTEVAKLIAYLIEPKENDYIYDPACGTGGLLIQSNIRFKSLNSENADKPKYYGQEINPGTYAMAKMNAIIHDMNVQISLGDTMRNPAYRLNNGELMRFDKVIANPMWNQKFDQSIYENDPFNRFIFGYPPSNSADLGWIQHMYSSLKDNGKLAVILDTGSVSRGSGSEGNSREKDIRKKIIENDLIESVILLPENLFYNTSSPGVIVVINKNKKHRDEILMINASALFEKGRPKNYIPDDKIEKIYDIYTSWKEENDISKIINRDDAIKSDYNLSPSRYISKSDDENLMPMEDIIAEIRDIEIERKNNDIILNNILKSLGYEGYENE